MWLEHYFDWRISLQFQARIRELRLTRCKTAAPPSSTRTTRPSFRRSVPSTSRRSKSTTRAATNSPLTSWTSWESNPAQGWCLPQLLSEISTINEGSWGVIMIFKLKQSPLLWTYNCCISFFNGEVGSFVVGCKFSFNRSRITSCHSNRFSMSRCLDADFKLTVFRKFTLVGFFSRIFLTDLKRSFLAWELCHWMKRLRSSL